MDPFEVLGVARDATVEQVEERWRLLARQLHPDGHPGADDAERARLTTAMAELNEARRAVLAVLQRPLGASSGAAASALTGARSAPRPAPVPEPPSPGAVRFVVGTIVAVLLLLLVTLTVVVVLATGDDGPTAETVPSSSAAPTVPSGPPTTWFVEWAIGSCISTGELVVPVDCGAPNAGRIVLRTTAPEFCPDWAEAYVRVDADVWCVDETA